MKFHAVVMAAQRPGVVNELAKDAGVSHKCLIEMAGKKLIEHVLDNLDAAEDIGFITVSIDDVRVLDQVPAFQRLLAAGKARAVEAKSNLFESLLASIEGGDQYYPAMITTADNVLLTSEMIGHFCNQLQVQGVSVGVGITPKEVMVAKYPDGQRRFHEFADGPYSNCNLYAIMDGDAAGIARVFKTGGQFAKSPMRVLKAFGIWNAIAYRFSWYSLDKMMNRLSRQFKVKVEAVRMPFAEAPIDVDNFRSKKLAGEILMRAKEEAA